MGDKERLRIVTEWRSLGRNDGQMHWGIPDWILERKRIGENTDGTQMKSVA